LYASLAIASNGSKNRLLSSAAIAVPMIKRSFKRFMTVFLSHGCRTVYMALVPERTRVCATGG